MSALSGSITLNNLTIPGTHDSCCDGNGSGAAFAKTQGLGITDQLFGLGIRFLDIRCNGLQGTASQLGIYHDKYYQNLRLEDVLNQCRAFLSQHPGETLIMRLRNESAGGQALAREEFKRRVNYYFNELGFRSLFWLNPNSASTWPTLSAARGRIVLLNDFDDSNEWQQITWGSDTWFRTQDNYQYGNPDDRVGLAAKAKAIVAQFDQAFLNPGAQQMYVNFTSFAGHLGIPYTNAEHLMPGVRAYLSARTSQRARFGIVPMDFPDAYSDIPTMLVQKNFV
ncbi:phosphatidylinositol-specific phospholipase C [Kitasatospora sp. MAA4]|uniref:phosphatidylinositol-specific phospholipase C n=1 Tax=Kitasatospora sp. MAA4 TaxID=3035093 RepID=UPI002474D2A0|nr:phosphatidylinositol-specific phospholipase C [Kitasatospora sp. MAA4]